VNWQHLTFFFQVDKIFVQVVKDAGLYDKIWQAFVVFLPVETVWGSG
jgi:GMP synthase (glutamine-hydrolysing)